MHRSSKVWNDWCFAFAFLVCEVNMLCQDQSHNVKHKTTVLLQKKTKKIRRSLNNVFPLTEIYSSGCSFFPFWQVYTPVHAPVYRPAYRPVYRPVYKLVHTPVYRPVSRPPYRPVYRLIYSPVYRPVHRPQCTDQSTDQSTDQTTDQSTDQSTD